MQTLLLPLIMARTDTNRAIGRRGVTCAAVLLVRLPPPVTVSPRYAGGLLLNVQSYQGGARARGARSARRRHLLSAGWRLPGVAEPAQVIDNSGRRGESESVPERDSRGAERGCGALRRGRLWRGLLADEAVRVNAHVLFTVEALRRLGAGVPRLPATRRRRREAE